jgi:hypothetical protein
MVDIADTVSIEDQEQIQEANAETMQFVLHLLKNGKSPMIVAGVMTAMALGVYKSILQPNEYDSMMDSISGSRNQIQSLALLLDNTSKVIH